MADDDTASDEVRRRFQPATALLLDPDDPTYGGVEAGSVEQARKNFMAFAGDQPTQNPSIQVNQKRNLSSQSTDFALPPPVTPPNLQDIPQPSQYGLGPNQQQQNPFSVFFNPMVLLGAASSLLTRKPLMGAMAYATGAMNGIRQGQQDVFDQNQQKFKDALAEAVAQNNVEIERYKTNVFSRDEQNWAQVRNGLWQEAVRNNDTGMQAAIKMGPEQAFKMLEMKEQAKNRIQTAFDLEREREAAKEAEIDRLKQDPGVQAIANSVRRYDIPMPPLSRTNPRNQAINELVVEQSAAEGAPYQESGYGSKRKFVTGLGATTVGSPGGQVNSAKIVIRHLATLDKLADDLGEGGNTVPFRRAAQTIQTEFGLSSAPTNFDAAVGLVAGEIIKLVEGSGGTGEDRARVVNAFDKAHKPELLHDAIDVSREVMAARVDALSEQAQAVHAEGEFNRHLPPNIRQLLEPRRAGKSFDVEGFRAKAKAEGYSDQQIDQFLTSKGH